MTLSLPYDQYLFVLNWQHWRHIKESWNTTTTSSFQIQDRIIGQMQLLFQVTPFLEPSSDSRKELSLTEVEL